MLEGSHFISGDRPAADPNRFRAIDPRSDEPLEPGFAEAGTDEVDAAVVAAAGAARTWAEHPTEKRAELLERAATEIEGLGDDLLDRAGRETALGVDRLVGERARTTGQLRFFADLLRQGWWRQVRIDTGDPDRTPVPKPDLRRTLRPLGPVAVFGASNFPLAFSVAGGDTASAWAAGCPVIVKGHPAHPGTSELVAGALVRAIEATGAPPGVFALLQGARHDLGRRLVEHSRLAAVAFTGSFAGGKALTAIAQARPRPIPVFAEMGSINPVVVLERALEESREAIAQGLATSVTLGCGQFCTNPGLVLLPAGPAADAFAERLTEALRAADTGDMTMVYDRIADGYRAALERASTEPGVKIVSRSDGGVDGGRIAAAVLRAPGETFLATPVLREEIYGPATLLVTWTSDQEFASLLDALPGSLAASVHAAEDELSGRPWLLDRLAAVAGRVIVNGFPTGVEVAHAMHHGGPFPACSDPRSTSVGSAAIERFLRPLCLQDVPDALLPNELKDANPLGIPRLVNGDWTKAPIGTQIEEGPP